jgi:N-terminal domain of NWD NACHT-NTPase
MSRQEAEDPSSGKTHWWSKHSSKAKEIFSEHNHEVASQNAAHTHPSQQSLPAASSVTSSSKNPIVVPVSGVPTSSSPNPSVAAQARENNMPTAVLKTPLAPASNTPVVSPQVAPVAQKDLGESAPKIEHTIFQLWNEAWEDLKIKEPKLVNKYEKKLASDIGANAMQAAVAPSSNIVDRNLRLQEMKGVLKQKMQAIDDKKWVLKFKDHELAVKDMIEPVVSIIDWGKDYVGGALEASPYASIAWSGVCLLLPVSFPSLAFDRN